MASSQTLAGAAFLLLLALSSVQTHARDSHFFSKVSAVTVTPTSTVPKEDQPSFVQETDNTGYGLYGHQTPETTPSNNGDATFNARNTNTNTNTINNKKYYNNDKYYGEDDQSSSSGRQSAAAKWSTSGESSEAGNTNNIHNARYYNNEKYYGEEDQSSAAGTTLSDRQSAAAKWSTSGESSESVANGINGNTNNNNYINNARYYNKDKYYGEDDQSAAAKWSTSSDVANGINGNSFSDDPFPNANGYNGNSFANGGSTNAVANRYNGNSFGDGGSTNAVNGYNGNSFADVDSVNGVEKQGMGKREYGNSFSEETSNGAAANLYSNDVVEKEEYAGGNNGVQRQGMSDTRYMAGGKYYVDVNNPGQYRSAAVNGEGNFGNEKYYGNGVGTGAGGSRYEQQLEAGEYYRNYGDDKYDP